MCFRQSPSLPDRLGRVICPRLGVRWRMIPAFIRVLVPAGIAAVWRLHVLSIAPIAHQLDAPFGSTFVVYLCPSLTVTSGALALDLVPSARGAEGEVLTRPGEVTCPCQPRWRLRLCPPEHTRLSRPLHRSPCDPLREHR
jgi:hypothetical protein